MTNRNKRIYTNILKNRSAPLKQKFTVTNSDWVKIADQKLLKGVDREYFSIEVKGEDPSVKILLSDEPVQDEDLARDISQGMVYENELRFFECDWYAKVKGTGDNTVVTVWVSNPNTNS